jgi:hypothetical protein
MRKRRLLGLAVLAVVLAAIAGFVAARAFAATAYYCNGCKLGSGGVPAVSASHSSWTDNNIYTGGYADEQIYNYSVSGGHTECSAASDHVDSLAIFCTPYWEPSTARCHLLHDTGPETAVCDADY